ncbi:hypothetical protein FQR65_LT18248 [Abscondita terminalis]|nr:hypothetical protein FQR65_LT18248 [Abscondita terminalis]
MQKSTGEPLRHKAEQLRLLLIPLILNSICLSQENGIVILSWGQVLHVKLLAHSRIIEDNVDKDRVGVIWGSGIGGLETFETEVLGYANSNSIPRFNPFFIPKMIADITPGNISIEYGFHGPNYTTVSACASSANAKANIIVFGVLKPLFITVSGVGGFNAMHAHLQEMDDSKTASRPFDKDRDGFVFGRRSGVCLEDMSMTVKRDAHHMTALYPTHPEGLGAYLVMKRCLDDAGVTADEVDHINMHGTSTPLGDIAESQAIAKLLGEHAFDIQINSTKSMTGHLLGAAGVIESIAALGTITHGVVPPTINHFTDDDKLDSRLNFTFNTAVKKEFHRTEDFIAQHGLTKYEFLSMQGYDKGEKNCYQIIANKSFIKERNIPSNLFEGSLGTQYLLNDHQDFDFLIKTQDSYPDFSLIVS